MNWLQSIFRIFNRNPEHDTVHPDMRNDMQLMMKELKKLYEEKTLLQAEIKSLREEIGALKKRS